VRLDALAQEAPSLPLAMEERPTEDRPRLQRRSRALRPGSRERPGTSCRMRSASSALTVKKCRCSRRRRRSSCAKRCVCV
jgi:hypothetical protein